MQLDRARGDTYPDVFTIKNAATGKKVNLTNCTFKMTVSNTRNPTDDADIMYQLIGEVEDPATGIVEFYPNSSQTDLVGYFYYDVQMTDSYGQVHTIESDVYHFVQDITK